jgi:hypothetical protein
MNQLQKEIAAKDPTNAPEILEQLAADEDYWIRFCVAQNPNTPPKTLELLATDEYYSIRYCVAQNPNRNEIIERLVLMTNYQQDQ